MYKQAPGRRSVLKICNKHHHDASPPKKTRRSSCICYVTEHSIDKLPLRRKTRRNLLHEFSENESSKGNIEDNKKHKRPPSRKDSTDSVIYVGTINSQDINSNEIPVVDLTQSSESLSTNRTVNFQSKSLKTLYFPSRNFDRSITLRKRLVTTSLINLPVNRKPVVHRRLFSATATSRSNDKLSILNIPNQFLDSSDHSFDEENILVKTDLTESDQKIIDWILSQDITGVSNRPASNDFSSLDTGFDSIRELCKTYDVGSSSNFD